MKYFPKHLFIITSALLINTIVHATEVQLNKQYNGGEVITASKAGVGFTVPEGWMGSLSEDGEFIMKSSNHFGMLLLTATPTNNKQVVANSLSKELMDLGGGFVFYPSASANIETNGITQNYHGKDPSTGAELMGHLHLLEGSYGQSVTLMVVGSAADKGYYNQLLHNTLNTVGFFDSQRAVQQTYQQSVQQNQQQNIADEPRRQRRTVINSSQNGSYVSGVNDEGQECAYVTVAGMTMKSCD
jgi:hypothetical protein